MKDVKKERHQKQKKEKTRREKKKSNELVRWSNHKRHTIQVHQNPRYTKMKPEGTRKSKWISACEHCSHQSIESEIKQAETHSQAQPSHFRQTKQDSQPSNSQTRFYAQHDGARVDASGWRAKV
ncbi:hypothetical protein BDR05DRAFT_92478 [Suillus weaverae]|nr:hypothetical protein BDR05DRAFT_92478 [Suillus weaverae]